MKQGQFTTRDGSLSHHHHHQAWYFSLPQEGRDDFLNLDPPPAAGLIEGFATSGPQCQPRASWTFPLTCLGLQSRVITGVIALLYNLLFPFSSVVCRKRNSTHTVHSSCAPEPQGLKKCMRVQLLTAVGGNMFRVRSYPSSAQGLL